MRRPSKPREPWTSYEVILPDEDGKKSDRGLRPVSAAFLRDGDPIETAITKMRLLQMHGWPAALKSLDIDSADKREPKIWILKCKPRCWRLYFCLYPTVRRILYLHAKCKKKDKRDEEDSQRARRLLDGVTNCRYGIILFEFPPE